MSKKSKFQVKVKRARNELREAIRKLRNAEQGLKAFKKANKEKSK